MMPKVETGLSRAQTTFFPARGHAFSTSHQRPGQGASPLFVSFGGFSPVKMRRKRFSLALAAAYFIPRSTHRLKQRLERV
jgi:hypothetical protein